MTDRILPSLARPYRFAKRHAALPLLPLVALLAACAGPAPQTDSPTVPVARPQVNASSQRDQATLRDLIARQDRLYRVSAPLLANNAALCRAGARNLLGFSVRNQYSYPPELLAAAKSLGLSERLEVSGVLPNTGSQSAGLQQGDRVLAIADQILPPGPDAERRAAILLGPLMLNPKNGIKLTLERNGVKRNAIVPLTRACAYSIELGNTDSVNSYSDGRRVLITRGMLDFAKTDDELAYVIAKEMAHSSLGHVQRQKNMAAAGNIIDTLSKNSLTPAAPTGPDLRPYTQELDASGDTLALYMLARANYDIDGATRFWQRLAAQYPASTPNGFVALHPATSFRVTAMDRANRTIKAKQAAGKPVTP